MAVTIALTLVLARPAAGPVVVLADPAVSSHAQLASAIVEVRPDARVIAPKESWSGRDAPRLVVALGDAARRDARTRWPKVPRASIWSFHRTETTPGVAELFIGPHTEPRCTANRLNNIESSARWIVLGDEADLGAHTVGTELGARVVVGRTAELHKAVRERPTGPTRIWIRATPSIANPAWLRYLGRNARRPGVWIGTDMPGLRRYGLAAPIAIDYAATAAAVLHWWTHLPSPRRRRVAQAQYRELPCRT